MPNFVSCDNEYMIGPITENFPVMTQAGFAVYEIPDTPTYDDRHRYDDYWDQHVTDGNVQFSPAVKGITLTPSNGSTMQPLLDRMNPALFTFFTNYGFVEAYPPAIIASAVDYTANANYLGAGGSCLLHTLNGLDSNGQCISSLQANFNLPAVPYFKLQIVRNMMPPQGMAWEARQWQFTFGDRYTLQFGGPDVYVYYQGQQIYRHHIADSAAETKFITSTVLRWTVENRLGNIYIACDQLEREIVVPNVGDLPAAPYGIYANAGQYAFNVTQYQFPTSGYIVTDPIQHWDSYLAADAVLAAFPPNQPVGCAVNISVYDENNSSSSVQTADAALINTALPQNTKRYKITLSGDGYHTPICQAFQYCYYPTYAPMPLTQWLEFTEWVKQGTITLSTQSTTLSRLGPVLRQATLEVLPDIVVNGQTLWQFLGLSTAGPLGDYAVRVKVGVVYDDGSINQIERICGQLTINAGAFPVDGVATKQFTVQDRWQRLHDTDLIWAPSVAGMSPALAISTLAQWAGIASGMINISGSLPAMVLTEPAGDPTRLYGDYTQPTWYPRNGTKADEFIKRIAEHYGLIVAFDGSGTLQITGSVSTLTPTPVYSRDGGAVLSAAVENFATHEDRQDCVNTVVVQGRDQYGKAIFAVMQDNDSVNTPGSALYVGYPVFQYIIDESLTTPAAVNYACYQHFVNRKAGYPTRTVVSHTNDGWQRIPNELVFFENALGNGEESIRLTQVTTEYPGHQQSYRVTLTGEVVI